MTFQNALNIAPGTSGQLLTSAGSGSPASFASAGVVSYFTAYASANISDVTGDGTAYTVVYPATLHNVGTNYGTGTGVFTAPETGYYLFTCVIWIYQPNASGITSCNLKLVPSTGGYYNLWSGNPVPIRDVSNDAFTMGGSAIIPMNASSTISTVLTCSGGAKGVDIRGHGAVLFSYWQGMRLE